jgi:hypothetical protein
MPQPLSWICSSLRPPSLTVTATEVDFASSEFSIISLRAFAGRWMICRDEARPRLAERAHRPRRLRRGNLPLPRRCGSRRPRRGAGSAGFPVSPSSSFGGSHNQLTVV